MPRRNSVKDELTKCNCWAAREGKQDGKPYVYCVVRAIYLPQEQARVTTSSILKACPGWTALEAELRLAGAGLLKAA